MTDPRLDELVSAYLDGELTQEERARVEADTALSARAEELRLAAALAATPVEPLSAAEREAALRKALDIQQVTYIDSRRRRIAVTRWVAVAAALVAVMAVGVSLLRLSDRRTERATSAGTPSESAAAQAMTADQLTTTADLGSFSDDVSLAAAARTALSERSAAAAAPTPNALAAPRGDGSAATQAQCAGLDGAYGDVVLDAPAVLRGTRVRVIVQRARSGAQELTVLSGCEVILQRPL